jgi:dTDP-glucose pyrophosphorylase
MTAYAGDLAMKWRTQVEFDSILLSANDTLHEGMTRMGESGLQVVMVVDDNRKLVGMVTDGDVRRGLLSGQGMKDPLSGVMQTKFHALPVTASESVAHELMKVGSFRHIPLVDDQGVIRDLVAWKDFFETVREKFDAKVVIMAGGKGTRLDPFTKILPKPMIPLGDKPILEVIIDKFTQQGFSEFILSLGYKSEIIRMYFAEHPPQDYQISFAHEEKPLGTAGALSLMKDQLDATFLVINCDVIIDPDMSGLMQHHREQGNDFTVVASQKEYPIPYGVLKTDGQNLVSIDEKPNFHFLINTGLYVIEPKVLELVKPDQFMNMTDLMTEVKKIGGKVGVYAHHGTWFDIGQWEDYRNSLRQMGIMD